MGERIKKLIGIEGKLGKALKPMANYSYSNIALAGAGYVISLYFTIFLTDVVNLKPGQAGIIVMIATIWDAVTDPVMGIITDRTRSKYGKHRRYILWGLPLFCVSFALMWNSYGLNGKDEPYKAMFYFVIMYMLYKTAYTIIEVPHVAMLPELAPDYNERTQYNSMGYIFNTVGMFPSFLMVILLHSVMKAEDTPDRKVMLITGILLSAVYFFAVFATYKTTRERSSLDNKNEKLDLRYIFREYYYVFKNRSFRQYFLMALTYQFANGLYLNSRVFYIKYLAGQYSKYGLYTLISGIAEASAFPLNYALTMKFGKKRCGSIVTPLMIAGFAIGLFMMPSHSGASSIIWTGLMTLSMILYPFGKSGLGFVTTNIFPDITDVDELITGRRREGVISTFDTLMKKSFSGLMAGFVGIILQVFGLATGDTVKQYEETTGLIYQQTDTAIFGVRLCVAILPIIASVISLLLLYRFKMTKDDHTMIRAAVATKHKYGHVLLNNREISAIEEITGQKFENTWLGKDNDFSKGHSLDKNENGEYIILLEQKEELQELYEEQK